MRKRAPLCRRSLAAGATLVLGAGACGPPGEAAEPFALEPVVRSSLLRLHEELEVPGPGPAASAPEELRGEVLGLVQFASEARGDLREAALEDAARLGPEAVPVLAEVVADPGAPATERGAACELLAAIGDEGAAEVLLTQAETAAESWVRSHAAWNLGRIDADWVVPRLVLRLRYEKDPEAIVWISEALARQGNLAGFQDWTQLVGNTGLIGMALYAQDEGVRQLAATRAHELAAELGFASPEEARDLWRYWHDAGRAQSLGIHERSERYELEVWRWIARLDEFQLRGVDDARFALSHLGPAAARILARALHDESVYVRSHAAQSLERMGARASEVGPELVRGLAEPGLAPHAAGALGRAAYPAAEGPLLACLGRERDPELRLAAARALGNLGLSSSAPGLRALLDEAETLELRQAAAESLVFTGHGEEVLAFLTELLATTLVDPRSSEHALRWYLDKRAREGSRQATETLEAWDALEPPFGQPEEPAETRRRRAERVALLEAQLAD